MTAQSTRAGFAPLAALLMLLGAIPSATAVIEISSDGEEDAHVVSLVGPDLAQVDELLGFATNPNVDECNTFTVTWLAGRGVGERVDAFIRNGVTIRMETLPPEVFGPHAQASGWWENAQMAWAFAGVLAKCTASGGTWCFCGVMTFTSKVNVFCAACCKRPLEYEALCFCDQEYPSAICGCFRRF